MFDVFINLVLMIWNLLKYPFYFILIIISIIFILFIINITYEILINKREFNKSRRIKVKKVSFFNKLFVQLPKILCEDFLNFNPDFFKASGLIIFEGIQGNGKTISLVQFITDLRKKYPKCKTTTNFNYEHQDDHLDHWSKLTSYNNGIYGVIAAIDETQNWFSSMQSKDFPPEMLSVVTQNRKNRRVICGTAQNFHMLAKSIRTQTTELRRCKTFLGCITLVHRLRPVLNSEGVVEKYDNLGFYFYIHTKELRSSYDTYKVIENLVSSGFQSKDYLDNTSNINTINIERNFFKNKKLK